MEKSVSSFFNNCSVGLCKWLYSAYNGYFECTCYHPLFFFNPNGGIEQVLLHNGNVYSSDDWQSAIKPIVEHYRGYAILRFFRGDAVFADPNLYCYL